MKKTIVLSAVALSFLNASEYNIFAISLSHNNETQLVKAYNQVSEAIKNSEYANEVVVKNRMSGSHYTVVAETADMSAKKARAIRDVIRKNTKYKDAYVIVKKPGEEPTFAESKQELEVLNPSSEAPAVVVQPESTKTSSFLDSLDKANTSKGNLFTYNGNGSLSLEAVVKDVLANNPNILNIKNEYLKSAKDLDIANSVYYPTLNLYANASYNTISKKPNTENKTKSKGGLYDASLVLNENLFNGGYDVNTQSQQSHTTNAAAYNLIQNSNELTYSVVSAYAAVVKAKVLVDIAEQNVSEHEKIYSLIKDRTKTGYARPSEEKQAGSRLALAKSNLLAAKNDLDDALNSFKKYYGQNIDANSLANVEANFVIPQDLNSFDTLSYKCSPSLKIQEENSKALGYAYEASKSNMMPKLDLSLSGKYEKSDIARKNIDSDKYNQTQGIAALNFSYNLFNKTQDKLNLEKAKLSQLSGINSLENTKRELEESNSFAFNSYVINKEKLDYLKQYVDYAKETLDTYEDEFKLGKRDLINLLDAQSEYFSSVREYTSTHNAYVLAQYKMLNNLGVLTDTFVNGYAKNFITFACSINDVK